LRDPLNSADVDVLAGADVGTCRNACGRRDVRSRRDARLVRPGVGLLHCPSVLPTHHSRSLGTLKALTPPSNYRMITGFSSLLVFLS
jgi:hypothetical protein